MRPVRAFVLASCVAVMTVGAAMPAHAVGGGAIRGGAVEHARSGAETAKRARDDGTAPAQWDLPKPEVVPHEDVAPPGAGGIGGDGVNRLSFTSFDTGDIIVVLGTTFGHAGCWSDELYSSTRGVYSYCIWSANTKPANGVQLEQPVKYRAYDRAYGLWVPSRPTSGQGVIGYCSLQRGEPYNIASSKTDYRRWYCSKLPWVAWKLKAGVDLDADGGYWVWPVDLVNDAQTSIFAKSS
ncbi:MAG: hypothetical protein RBS17_05260 [Coriobacteriia bacterium]|nr:hypothetical protein [Coriobacteriia bacterium]